MGKWCDSAIMAWDGGTCGPTIQAGLDLLVAEAQHAQQAARVHVGGR